jgi:hypothetical protein
MIHGAQKFEPRGSDNKCGKPHPSTCQKALRNNECNIEGCKFYHMKGTRISVHQRMQTNGPEQTQLRENLNQTFGMKHKEDRRCRKQRTRFFTKPRVPC